MWTILVESFHYDIDSLKELFEKVAPDSILLYLYEIGLFYRL